MTGWIFSMVARASAAGPTRPVSGVMASSHTTMACELPLMSCCPQAPTRSAGTSRPGSPAVRYQSQIVAAIETASSPYHSGGQPSTE
jgi:hypothetical protein